MAGVRDQRRCRSIGDKGGRDTCYYGRFETLITGDRRDQEYYLGGKQRTGRETRLGDGRRWKIMTEYILGDSDGSFGCDGSI